MEQTISDKEQMVDIVEEMANDKAILTTIEKARKELKKNIEKLEKELNKKGVK